MSATVVSCMLTMAFSVSAEEVTYSSEIKWTPGEERSYTISKTRNKSKAGKTGSDVTSTTDVKITVIDASSTGYLIGWQLGETKLNDPKLSANPIFQSTSNMLNGFELLLEVSSDGSILGIQNWKEVQNRSNAVVEELISFLKDNSALSDTQIAQFTQQIKSMYSTREQIVQLTTREAQVFFFTLGKRYRLAEPIAYELNLPNQFGGEPFPAYATLELESLDTETNLAKVVWEQYLDEAESSRIMLNTMTALAKSMGQPAPSKSEIPDIEVSDIGEFKIEASSGWIQQLEHTRTTTTGEDSQSDIMVITKK